MSNTPLLDSLYPKHTVDLIKSITVANPAEVDGFEVDATGKVRQWYDGPGRNKLAPVKRAYLATPAGIEYQIHAFLEHKAGDHDGSMFLYTRDIATDTVKMHVVFFTETSAQIHALRDRVLDVSAHCTQSQLLPSRTEASLIGAVLKEYEQAARLCAKDLT